MRNKMMILVLASIVGVLTACSTDIGKIKDNPDKYDNKVVTVEGEVSRSANLLVVKLYEVTDQTGSIYVVSKEDKPEEGKHIKVKGKVEQTSFDELKFKGVVIDEMEKEIM